MLYSWNFLLLNKVKSHIQQKRPDNTSGRFQFMELIIRIYLSIEPRTRFIKVFKASFFSIPPLIIL